MQKGLEGWFRGGACFVHFTSNGVAGKVIFDSGLPNASEYLSAMSDVFGQFKGESAFSNENVNLICSLVLSGPLGVCRRMRGTSL